jgi:hypothetical protein
MLPLLSRRFPRLYRRLVLLASLERTFWLLGIAVDCPHNTLPLRVDVVSHTVEISELRVFAQATRYHAEDVVRLREHDIFVATILCALSETCCCKGLLLGRDESGALSTRLLAAGVSCKRAKFRFFVLARVGSGDGIEDALVVVILGPMVHLALGLPLGCLSAPTVPGSKLGILRGVLCPC